MKTQFQTDTTSTKIAIHDSRFMFLVQTSPTGQNITILGNVHEKKNTWLAGLLRLIKLLEPNL